MRDASMPEDVSHPFTAATVSSGGANMSCTSAADQYCPYFGDEGSELENISQVLDKWICSSPLPETSTADSQVQLLTHICLRKSSPWSRFVCVNPIRIGSRASASIR